MIRNKKGQRTKCGRKEINRKKSEEEGMTKEWKKEKRRNERREQ
jgi:hypothetical protein